MVDQRTMHVAIQLSAHNETLCAMRYAIHFALSLHYACTITLHFSLNLMVDQCTMRRIVCAIASLCTLLFTFHPRPDYVLSLNYMHMHFSLNLMVDQRTMRWGYSICTMHYALCTMHYRFTMHTLFICTFHSI